MGFRSWCTTLHFTEPNPILPCQHMAELQISVVSNPASKRQIQVRHELKNFLNCWLNLYLFAINCCTFDSGKPKSNSIIKYNVETHLVNSLGAGHLIVFSCCSVLFSHDKETPSFQSKIEHCFCCIMAVELAKRCIT